MKTVVYGHLHRGDEAEILPIDATQSARSYANQCRSLLRKGELFAKLLPIVFVPSEFDNLLEFKVMTIETGEVRD